MDKIDKLLNHKSYIAALDKITEYEINREFCKHGIEHLLDVARIAYIINLEEHLQIPKEIIYAVALLHDIGRGAQYSVGTPHNEASVEISRVILDEIGFTDIEQNQILNTIHHHGNHGDQHGKYGNHYSNQGNHENYGNNRKEFTHNIEDNLCYIMNHADQLSRTCFHCSAYEQCYWNISMKNKTIYY